jgi:hypothetical protein
VVEKLHANGALVMNMAGLPKQYVKPPSNPPLLVM